MLPSMRGYLRWFFGEGGHRPGDIKISFISGKSLYDEYHKGKNYDYSTNRYLVN